jgi:hypothetical protein
MESRDVDSQAPLSSIPPTPLEKLLARMRAGWTRLMAKPASRWATYGVLGVAATLALWGGIVLVQPKDEPIDAFIARWNEAVEAEDDAVYDALLERDLIDTNPQAWKNGFDLLKDLNASGLVVEPLEADPPPGALTTPVRAVLGEGADVAELIIDRGDREVALHLRRSGWGKKWKVADIVSTGPVVTEPEPVEQIEEMHASANVDASDEGGVSLVSLDETPPLDTEFKLRQILESWRDSWEQKNIDEYMQWYADYAIISRVTVVNGREIPETLTKAQLRERMKRLVKRYSRIKVDVSNVRIRGSYAEADMRFQQDFASWTKGGEGAPVYQDKGIKTLKFVNDSGDWRIYEEGWRTYVDVPTYPLN